ncbi:hypothetical protein [Intrasporangium sp.]|uniref:hypothetical protein n=1 Tax=Intrasporangium sp. TaxID=1925024 RepID=UPI0032219068
MTDLITRLLRWPLWSWRNLTITAAVLLAALAGIGRIGAALQPDQAPSASTQPATVMPSAGPAASSPPSPAPATSTATPASTPTETVAAQPASDCARAAEAFLRAWARPTLAAPAWLAGLRPYAAASLLADLATTDPSRVPAARVLTDPQPVHDKPGASFRVVTDAGPVLLHTVTAHGECLVEQVEPDDDVPGAPTPRLTSSSPARSRSGG